MSSRFRECRIAFFGLFFSSLVFATASGQDFELVVGGTAGAVSWPGAEAPENVINQEGQKYLNFLRENTGFYIRPEGPNASDVPTSITFWTANDAEERDPASYQLFGSNSADLLTPLDYLPQERINFDLFTEIAFGDLDLPSSRNDGGDAFLDDDNSETLQFTNNRAYENYLVLFPDVKDVDNANSMQIAEVQLNYDGSDLDSGIFDFDDEIAGVGLLEVAVPDALDPLVLEDYKFVVGAEHSAGWPGGEGPENAINWQGQKYLNFARENTGVLVRPEGSNANVAPTSITFWTANDSVERDPASFRLLGSNDASLLSPVDYAPLDEILLDSFTEIALGNLALPARRNDGGDADLDDANSQTIEFQNTSAFDNYVVVFPTVKDGENANSMQIAEIQLNYDGFDLDSGVLDLDDSITGIAMVNVDAIIDPVDPGGPGTPVVTNPIQPINVLNYEIVIGSDEFDPVRWPGGEAPANAIDGEGQKYLNFEKENSGILVRAQGLNSDEIPTSITLWAANDAEPRDPASFRLFGTNDGDVDFPLDYEHEDTIPLELFTEIAIGDLQLPSSRNEGGDSDLDDDNSQTFEFENNEQFETYLVVFPTLKDSENANSMQVAEIQLNYDGSDIDSGIFDFDDETTGIALVALEGICDPNTMGDLDGDGEVAFADFLTLSTNFGAAVLSHEDGDIDCNGTVEFADFLALSSNFGQTVATSPVPEPSGSALMVLAMCGLLAIRRKS